MTLKATIADTATGKTVVRDFTDDELAQKKADGIDAKATAQAETDKAARKAARKAALLNRLGITADEAQLLI